MHDRRLEDQLRSALRAEGDGQPLTITPAELERRLVLRRRARNSQRFSLVAAAVAVVAIGSIVAIGNGWLRTPDVGVDPSPQRSATPTPAPSAPTSPPSASTASPTLPDLPALTAPAGTVAVDMIGEPEPNVTGETTQTSAGLVPPRGLYRIAFTCVGTGLARWDIGIYRLAGGDEQPCDGSIRETETSEGVPPEDMGMVVTTSPHNRWHIIATYEGDPPGFIAPQLFALPGEALVSEATGGLARCVEYNGASDSCAAPFLARDGANPVAIPVDGEVGIALAGTWLIDRVAVDIVERDLARADPFTSGRRLIDIDEGGQRVQVPMAGLPAGEYVLRLILDGSSGDDTFGGVYDIPVIVGS